MIMSSVVMLRLTNHGADAETQSGISGIVLRALRTHAVMFEALVGVGMGFVML